MHSEQIGNESRWAFLGFEQLQNVEIIPKRKLSFYVRIFSPWLRPSSYEDDGPECVIEWAWSPGNESSSFLPAHRLAWSQRQDLCPASGSRNWSLVCGKLCRRGEEQSPQSFLPAELCSCRMSWTQLSVSFTQLLGLTLCSASTLLCLPGGKTGLEGCTRAQPGAQTASHLPWDVNLQGWSLCSLLIQILAALGNTDLIWSSKARWQGYC